MPALSHHSQKRKSRLRQNKGEKRNEQVSQRSRQRKRRQRLKELQLQFNEGREPGENSEAVEHLSQNIEL